MRTLTVSPETFSTMLSSIVQSGVTFEAVERDNKIIVTFTGGY